MVVTTCYGPAAAAVVNQRIDGLLKHAFLVADNDFRGLKLYKSPEPIVAVYDTSVEVIQVTGRKSPTVQLDHGS